MRPAGLGSGALRGRRFLACIGSAILGCAYLRTKRQCANDQNSDKVIQPHTCSPLCLPAFFEEKARLL
jgi:hypothetical protein